LNRREQLHGTAFAHRVGGRAGQQRARFFEQRRAARQQCLHARQRDAIAAAHDAARLAQIEYRVIVVEQCARALHAVGQLESDESHRVVPA